MLKKEIKALNHGQRGCGSYVKRGKILPKKEMLIIEQHVQQTFSWKLIYLRK